MPEASNLAVTAMVGILALYVVQASLLWMTARNSPESLFEDVKTPHVSLSHDSHKHIKQDVVKVTDGVYVAVGFSIANSIMLEGSDGLVIIDTTLNVNVAREIRDQFRKISRKPIKAIIYTHFHPDHTYGVEAFIEDPESPPQIWAHKEFMNQMMITSVTGKIGFARARRQFGLYLPESAQLPGKSNFKFDKTFESTPVFPTHLVKGKQQLITVAGINLELLHLPGETEDHLAVYWPKKSVVCPGDNIYKAFPNLYAIRGSPGRDIMQWAKSIDNIIALNPKHLVPSHTEPISGTKTIIDTLTTYRDGIQYIHDQTIRHMNKGIHPHDVMGMFELPKALAEHPYLEPVYGTVPWSVRGVFDFYMGWFSGEIEDLSPMGTFEKAEKMIDLAGGKKKMMKKATLAYNEGELQWAFQLSSYLFKVYPDYPKALELRTKCLKEFANIQTSINGRQYYLSQVLEDHKFGEETVDPRKMLKRLPLDIVFDVMTTRLRGEECSDKDIVVLYEFTDTQETFAFHLRNGVFARLTQIPKTWNLKLTTTEKVFREILAKEESPFGSYTSGKLTIDGGMINFKSFQDCFEKET